MFELVVLFAAIGSALCAGIGWFVRRKQGAIVGVIVGAVLGPLLWIVGIFLLWPGV